MTKLDDIGAGAAAQLRTAVTDHLDTHPRPAPRLPRVPRMVVALGLATVVAFGGTVLANTQRDDTSLQTADNSDSSASALDPEGGEGGGSVSDGAGGTIERPARGEAGDLPGSRTNETTPPTLPGQGEPPADTGNEPPSETGSFGACSTRIESNGTAETPDWCMDGQSQQRTDKGHPLMVSICRDPRAGDSSLNFDRRQEADFLIRDVYGRELWRWSMTRPAVAHPHQRPVEAGTCVVWTVYWDEREQSGRQAANGEYHAEMTVLADEANGEWKPSPQVVRVGSL